ncbi:MAG TPA: hypothetical protein VER17_21205 [Tepidisphaeraceae bacterium]|nr:hypothetical protein [Tepidisphaeraceae bacterium]
MPLVEFIRHTFPSAYWSAGFIACLVMVLILSAALWIITRWPAWVFTGLAAVIYMVPFFLHKQY